eukprot:m.24638 g.24638  ORF g.24638 m.24638 type:complete len:426 (+) comp7626_c0_seq2:528-1805(+)
MNDDDNQKTFQVQLPSLGDIVLQYVVSIGKSYTAVTTNGSITFTTRTGEIFHKDVHRFNYKINNNNNDKSLLFFLGKVEEQFCKAVIDKNGSKNSDGLIGATKVPIFGNNTNNNDNNTVAVKTTPTTFNHKISELIPVLRDGTTAPSIGFGVNESDLVTEPSNKQHSSETPTLMIALIVCAVIVIFLLGAYLYKKKGKQSTSRTESEEFPLQQQQQTSSEGLEIETKRITKQVQKPVQETRFGPSFHTPEYMQPHVYENNSSGSSEGSSGGYEDMANSDRVSVSSRDSFDTMTSEEFDSEQQRFRQFLSQQQPDDGAQYELPNAKPHNLLYSEPAELRSSTSEYDNVSATSATPDTANTFNFLGNNGRGSGKRNSGKRKVGAAREEEEAAEDGPVEHKKNTWIMDAKPSKTARSLENSVIPLEDS